MQIGANVKSRAWKRNADKKIATILGVSNDLRDMVGRLELNAHTQDDIRLLTALYNHIFGFTNDARGRVVIFDAKGKQVLEYGPKIKAADKEE